MSMPALEGQFPEVLVFRHEDAGFAGGFGQDDRVLCSREIFADPRHIVAGPAQEFGR